LALGEGGFEGLVDELGGFTPAQVLQQQHARKQYGARVGHVLARVLGGGAVRCLKHGGLVADVGAGGEADASRHGGGGVGEVVAVEVGRGDDAVFIGPELDLLKHAVGNAVLDQQLALGG